MPTGGLVSKLVTILVILTSFSNRGIYLAPAERKQPKLESGVNWWGFLLNSVPVRRCSKVVKGGVFGFNLVVLRQTVNSSGVLGSVVDRVRDGSCPYAPSEGLPSGARNSSGSFRRF